VQRLLGVGREARLSIAIAAVLRARPSTLKISMLWYADDGAARFRDMIVGCGTLASSQAFWTW
jgi:hypothetical protein